MGNVTTQTLISAESIAASASHTSDAVVLGDVSGSFSAQLALTGDGTAKLEVLCSNDGSNFVAPEGVNAIMSSKTKTTGNYLASFAIPVCYALKLKVTETGGAQAVVATVTLAMS